MDIEVVDVPEARRYEARTGGEVAGIVAYRRRPDAVVLIHTEVDAAYEGRGVATALAKGVLDDIRAQGAVMVPQCPFIASYVRRHPEYRDLIAESARAAFDA
jgi:predicted GNAT family acetyltransferase